MRSSRLLLPLALLVFFASASPALAFDWRVDVMSDFSFQPSERHIAVGDTVTWYFNADGHTTTSVKGQPESWNSAPNGSTNSAGAVYPKVFNTPGRYQYICIPHQTFMKGVIQVGTDTVVDSIDNFKSKRSGNRVTLSFLLKEPATVSYKLTGKSRRTVKRGRLAAGKHSFALRRLKRGAYRGVLTVVDDFDKKVTPRNSFVIR
jgi:plastocyanin